MALTPYEIAKLQAALAMSLQGKKVRPRNEDTWRSEHEDDDDWWRGGERDLGPPG